MTFFQEPEVSQRVDSSGDNGRSDGGDSGNGSQDGRSTRGRQQEIPHGTAKVRYLPVLLFLWSMVPGFNEVECEVKFLVGHG